MWYNNIVVGIEKQEQVAIEKSRRLLFDAERFYQDVKEDSWMARSVRERVARMALVDKTKGLVLQNPPRQEEISKRLF